MGEVELRLGEAAMEFWVKGVLLLVEDGAHSEEVGFVYWRCGISSRRLGGGCDDGGARDGGGGGV